MKKSGLIAVALIAGFLFTGCGYNKMVTMDEAVTSAWAQVENVYQRRADLIPNLVETVKGYAQHEQETFTRVIEARAQAPLRKLILKTSHRKQLQFQDAQQGALFCFGKTDGGTGKLPRSQSQPEFSWIQSQLEGTENGSLWKDKNSMKPHKHTYLYQKVPEPSLQNFRSQKAYFEAQPGAQAPVKF